MNKQVEANKSKKLDLNWVFDVIVLAGKLVWDVAKEFFYGIRYKSLPATACNICGMALLTGMLLGYDKLIFKKFDLIVYPTNLIPYALYLTFLGSLGYIVWSFKQLAIKRRLRKHLLQTFQHIGLKNHMGTAPTFICDIPTGEHTRLLKLNREYVSFGQFVEMREKIADALQIFIDEMVDHRENGSIDISYSFLDLERKVLYSQISFGKRDALVIGKTRTSTVTISLDQAPHFLVAGETSSGKSTFLRQMIVTLYRLNPSYEFHLIDLKGGLEFQAFEGYSRIRVKNDPSSALAALTILDSELDRRMSDLKNAKAKDLRSYNQSKQGQSQPMRREIIVIDEATELFLAGPHICPKDVQAARSVMSRITRLGRAVGLHVIIGTQRPDARAIDTQIKANLVAKVCFQMANNTSSIIVLDNASAADLPKIPGRAIWQYGMDSVEVQTPFLEASQVQELLGEPEASDNQIQNLIQLGDSREF